jgi:hypothetical protein
LYQIDGSSPQEEEIIDEVVNRDVEIRLLSLYDQLIILNFNRCVHDAQLFGLHPPIKYAQ